MIIDSIILEESKIHFPLRTRDLVRYVCERTGKGERTIYRRLEKLKNEGTVCVFNSEKLNSIFQYETHDEKASYIVVSEMAGIIRHFDEILHDIEKRESDDIVSILDEVLLYKHHYALNPVQLDEIVPLLNRDGQIEYIALHILYQHIIKNDIQPRNIDRLVTELRKIANSRKDEARYDPRKKWTIHLLGYFKDDAVLDQLYLDSTLFSSQKELYEIYLTEYTADVITRNPSSMYAMIIRLRKLGESERANNIEHIRKIALGYSNVNSHSPKEELQTGPSPFLCTSKQKQTERSKKSNGWWYK